MSRPSIALVCAILLILVVLGTAAPTWAGDGQNSNSNQHDDQQLQQQQQQQHQQQQQQERQQQRRQEQQQQQQQLIEVTPDLEHQLQQARRLNERDSDDEITFPEEAYRYDLVGPQTQEMFAVGGSGGDERPIVQTRNWFDRVQLGNNQKRRSASGGLSFSWLPSSTSSLRYSRGSPRYYHTKEDEAKYSAMPLLLADQKEDKAYAFAALPSAIETINNGESASRDSLWPSRQLRDLLIAQESANRARRLEQLTRAAMIERRLKAAGKSNRTGSDERLSGIDFLQTREKKRRCKVDPNLGVKNPSFCDTDAYFGAADYSMRDVWDSAGKR